MNLEKFEEIITIYTYNGGVDKRPILLDEYDFSDGELRVIFTFDRIEYVEDYIDEDIFETYINDSGRLEFFEDRWDGYSESHYTKEYIDEVKRRASKYFELYDQYEELKKLNS